MPSRRYVQSSSGSSTRSSSVSDDGDRAPTTSPFQPVTRIRYRPCLFKDEAVLHSLGKGPGFFGFLIALARIGIQQGVKHGLKHGLKHGIKNGIKRGLKKGAKEVVKDQADRLNNERRNK